MNIGFSEVILLIIVGLLLFGPKKLPELGRAFGKNSKKNSKMLYMDWSTIPIQDQKTLLRFHRPKRTRESLNL